MSLISFIEKIQAKPKHIRIKILWLLVSLAMFFIVSGWVISLKRSLSLSVAKNEVHKTEESSKMPSLIESLKASINSFFEKNKEEIPENKTQPQENNINSELNEGKVQPAKLPLSR